VTAVFVDANVFLRFFTMDDEGQHQRAVKLFREASGGKVSLVTGPPVLFEVTWTLRSAYKQPNEKILDALSAISAFPGLHLMDADLVEEAVSLARSSGQEFADAYIVASARRARAQEIATFNQEHFKKLGATLYNF
jgi:predicted nucleic acid-binding protein